jgi:hypothetical protein
MLLLQFLMVCGVAAYGQDATRDVVNTKFRQQRAGVQTVAGESRSTLIGVNIWRGRPSRPSDQTTVRSLLHKAGQQISLTPELAAPGTVFSKGEFIRIGIEVAREGYLYLFNQELCGTKAAHEPVMIFPTLHLRRGDNRVRPGFIVNVPSWSDEPPFLEIESHCPGSSDRLFVLYSPTPLPDLRPGDTPLRIDPARFEQWTRLYGDKAASPVSIANAGRAATAEEKLASTGGPLLRPADPVPQIVFPAQPAKDQPVMVSFDLRVK